MLGISQVWLGGAHCQLLLDIVAREGPSILKLLSQWNTFLVLNLHLDVVNHVGRLNLKGDCLSHEGLDENLHPSTEMQDEMEGQLLLNVTVRKDAAILKLLSSKDKMLLVRRGIPSLSWIFTFMLSI